MLGFRAPSPIGSGAAASRRPSRAPSPIFSGPPTRERPLSAPPSSSSGSGEVGIVDRVRAETDARCVIVCWLAERAITRGGGE